MRSKYQLSVRQLFSTFVQTEILLKRHLYFFFIFFALVAQAQIGAKIKQTQNSIVGIWQNSTLGFQMTLMLNNDNSGEFDGESITYSAIGNKLSIKSASETTVYNYVLQNNTLTLSGGDLDKPLNFTKAGGNDQPAIVKKEIEEPIANSNNIIGLWSGNGESIEFTKEGKCNYLGQTYQYELASGHVTLITSQGNIMMAYAISNSQLTLTVNGKKLIYSKGRAIENQMGNSNGSGAEELVGKWCYVNVYSNSTGGSSSENCITLNADGTYEYYGESSRSVNTSTFYGGTSTQSVDRGTWSVQGNTIFYNSQTRGKGSYQFQKQNHPKNGDPMIVIDGQTYVTFYNKTPWR
jgi:hypothetical protein